MRRITVFDDDFELLAVENGFNIDAKKEWKQFLKDNDLVSDILLDYDQMNDLILKFISFDIDNIDIAYAIIMDFENKHPERLEGKNEKRIKA